MKKTPNLKELYENQIDEVFAIMANIDKYNEWLVEEKEKLRRANLRAKVLEEEMAISKQ